MEQLTGQIKDDVILPTPEAPKEEVVEPKPEEPKEEPKEAPKEEAKAEDVPFHRHPKFKRLMEENKRIPELERQLNELQTVTERLTKATKPLDEVSPEVKFLYGEDKKAQEALNSILEKKIQEKEAAREQARIQAEQKAKDAEVRFKNWAEDQFAELEEKTGKPFTKEDFSGRNEILKIVQDLKLTRQNENGETWWDIPTAITIHERYLAQQAEARPNPSKEVAKKMTEGKSGPAPKSKVLNQKQLRSTSFAKYLSGME